MWRNPITQEIFELHWEIRAAHPYMSLPVVITDELLTELGYEVIKPPIEEKTTPLPPTT